MHVVYHGQHRLEHVGAAAFDELHLLAQGALAEVVEFGLQPQAAVFPDSGLLRQLLGLGDRPAG